MKKVIQFSFITAMVLASSSYANETAKELGKTSGELRFLSSGYNNDNATNTYATAVGMQLKYELNQYKGFGGGVAFQTSHDINFATGDGAKQNDELSGQKGSYTELTQAYVEYNYQKLNLRFGRQIIDTPLADSDDIRMIFDTFEAYIASYEMDKFSFMGGYLRKWQGVDASLDNHWVKTGKDGTFFGGVTFTNDYVEANGWIYNISKGTDANTAFYVDVIGNYTYNDIIFHTGMQYLGESEEDDSGVKASIFGVMGEASFNQFTFNLAYNQSSKEKGKHSFRGFGGGSLFTNMDTMILDEITEDRDADAIMVGLAYEMDQFHFSYSYGDFNGDKNSAGKKAHIVEHDLGVEYTLNDALTMNLSYIIDDNKEDTNSADFNDKNIRFFTSYSF